MTTTVFLSLMCLVLSTIVLVFGMKHVATVLAARASLASDEALRSLAQRAISAQSESQAELSAIRDELSKLGASMASVEKILRQVE